MIKGRGEALFLFGRVASSVGNVTKFGSKDRMYLKLFSQASNDEMLSLVVRDHCFGGHIVYQNVRLVIPNDEFMSVFNVEEDFHTCTGI